jgi:hypothetical protein
MLLRRSCPALFLLTLFAAPAAFGQAKDSPIAFVNEEAITTSFVPTLAVGPSSGSTATATNQWLKVEFHYGTTPALTTNFLDSAEFKVWIEGFDPLAKNAQGTTGVSVALTGSVTYINIPAGRDIYGVFYVHPNTLARYSDDRGYENYDRKYDVHIEAYVGGALMDAIDKRKEQDPNWYKPLTVVPNLVYRQDQCPFMLADPDRYPAIKLPAQAP